MRDNREMAGEYTHPTTIANALHHIKSRHHARAGAERFRVDSKLVEHHHEEIAQRHIVKRIEGQMLPMLESAAGEEDRQVSGDVATTVHLASCQHHGAVEQG